MSRFGSMAALVAGLSLAAPAAAAALDIPAFARKYGVSCSMCHAPAPRLNAFGEQFAANGFEMAAGEPARDTVDTGDPLLRLQAGFPIAVRIDAFAQASTATLPGQAAVDLAAPYGIKLLSGGQIADGVSYYMYFFLSERGEVAGLEDAYLQFTDVLGAGVDVVAGQFQVSDPLFKRELRLEFEDYQPYRVRVGDARADLTYDRGLLVAYSPWAGGDLAFEVLNGRGLDPAGESKNFDSDDWKNLAVRYSQEAGPLRVGGFGYFGLESRGGVDDRIRIWGPDVTLSLGSAVELNAQLLRREDSHPYFDDPARPADTTVDAAFAELVWGPDGPTGRLFLTGLANWVEADEPIFTVRQGEAGPLSRYRTGALGATYLLHRNLRGLGEAQWDFDRDGARFTLGVVAAF